MSGRDALEAELHRLHDGLPPGATFTWTRDGGALGIAMLRVPATGRGVGTRFLASVLAAADAAGTPTRIEADASLLPGDPPLRALVRTYARFGFVASGMTDAHFVAMSRDPRPPRGGAGAILEDYRAGRAGDTSEGEWATMLGTWLEAPRRAS